MPRCYVPEALRFTQLLIDSSLTLGLLTAPPSASYGGTELDPSVNAPGYSRQPVILVPSGNLCAGNLYAITFTPAGSWPVCEYFGIFDAATTMLYWGMLNLAVSSSGGAVTIQAGAAYVDWLNNSTSLLPNFGQLPATCQSIGPVDTINAFSLQMMPVTSLPSGPLTASGLTGGVPDLSTDYLTLNGSLTAGVPILPTDYMTLINGQTGRPSSSASSAMPISNRFARPSNSYPANYVALSNGSSMALIDNIFARPRNQNVLLRRNLLAEPQTGFLKIRRMIDATRGTTAGFTANGPNSIAF